MRYAEKSCTPFKRLALIGVSAARRRQAASRVGAAYALLLWGERRARGIRIRRAGSKWRYAFRHDYTLFNPSAPKAIHEKDRSGLPALLSLCDHRLYGMVCVGHPKLWQQRGARPLCGLHIL